jgi:uncharacterized repeat protein (TIGR01451 family)
VRVLELEPGEVHVASSVRTPKARLAAVGGALAVLALVGLTMFSPTAGAGGPVDLALEKSDSPDPVEVGSVLTYTIAVEHQSGPASSEVVVEDKLPNRVDFISANASEGTCDRQGRTITCTLGSVLSGSATVTIEVRPKKDGRISNTASVSDTFLSDPDPSDNEDTETTKVIKGPSCGGRAATIIGTPGDDVITGTDQRDVVAALGGDDQVNALGGKDAICGKSGDDLLKGKADADLIKGGGGRDTGKGGGGDDIIRGGPKPDRLRGGSGDDLLAGGGGNDNCRGGPGTDTLKSC